MSDLRQKLVELAGKVELRELITTGTLARRTAGRASSLPGEHVDLEIVVRVGMVRQADVFVALIAITVRARRSDGTPPFVKFVQRFNVRYGGHGDASDEVLLEFINTNGMMHVWPYMRSFVQSASASLSLVPILLPVFRVQAPNGLPLTTQGAPGAASVSKK